MARILLIDADRGLPQSVALECLENGIAVRMAETVCEGVRYMLDGPVSIVLMDAALMRLSGAAQARLFDVVAPGVPVVALVDPTTRIEDIVKLEVEGFHVVPKPFDVLDVLAKVGPARRSLPARPGATEQIDTVCR